MKNTKCYVPGAAKNPSSVKVCLQKTMGALELATMYLQTIDPSLLPESVHAALLEATSEAGLAVRLAQNVAPQVRGRKA